MPRPHPTADNPPEAGFMLLAVVVMCALVLIALSVAAPVIARDLRRDKEVESEHRAEQYVRAIQLFYRKNNAYPASIKALENTNNVRYLRQQYVDPLTGQADYRLIHQGQQKTTIKTFFGKELAGLPTAGLGSASGMQSGPGVGTSTTGTSLTTGCNGMNSAFCQQQQTTSTSGGGPGATGSTGSTGSSGAGMFGDAGGGGPIVGVGTSRTGDSILNPNGQTTYETWEFWYDPRIEQLKKGVNILGGGMSSGNATGLGGGFGTSPTTSPAPTSTPGAPGPTTTPAPTGP